MEKVLVVIPAKNEAETVADIIRQCLAYFPVLVVNDHSTDATGQIAHLAGANVIDLSNSTGYGAALLGGFQQMICQGYQHVVTLDADGAHDPADLPAISQVHFSTNANLTLGDRFSAGMDGYIPSPKRWANYFATTIVNRLLGLSLGDVACGFRVLDQQLVERLLKAGPSNGFAIVLQLLDVAVRCNFRIRSCPVDVRYAATELHATTQRELLDALFAVQIYEDAQSSRTLRPLLEAVKAMRPFTIRVGKVTLCCHPVGCAYAFQRHPDCFPKPDFGEYFDFDSP